MEQKSANKWKERAKRLKSDVPAVFLALIEAFLIGRNSRVAQYLSAIQIIHASLYLGGMSVSAAL